ncbi:PREDICTED: uncharacterized protein LOC109580729 isoform X2 [Amphimedon queenslandica]|uniref:HECT domain-containing protein n=1 Tax=Amphimedon queenslandica TaxID=400682 RepID=A0AAN0IZ13_AMPQE|nr:PREDICTED: uncharacterized protein LOC109580729 isoform X2 [Amphimedon queenslandica]|eukprot:XP_019849772.1 PREDICTED: uncharacterized protein LOC109580729 isoform X2 [Amphimedon queenslandica]
MKRPLFSTTYLFFLFLLRSMSFNNDPASANKSLQTVLQEALRQLESHQLSQLINTQAVNISPTSDHGPSGTIPSVSFSVTQPVSICPVPATATPTTSRFISSTSGAIPVPQPSYNFHWNPKSLIGRKRKSSQSSSSAKCKEKKAATWTHTYVCLAKRDQVIIPNGQERAALQIAGLGEKTITVSRDADSQDMYDAIILDFPKLQQAGGFELLKIPDNGGKLLSIIEIPSTGYTASFLKPVARNAKLYIRPLQRNLSLEPCYNHHESLIGPPKENCLKCGKAIPIAELKSHISMCENSQNLGCSSEFFSTNQQEVFEDGVHFDPIEEVGVHMDPVVGTTCRSNDESNDHIVPSPVLYSNEDVSLVSIIEELQCNMEGDTFEMVVSRPTVLENALRRMMKPSFDPLKRLKDGPPLRLFAHSVYDFMCGIEPSQINVKISEVSDFLVQDFLLKVESMQDESSLKELLNDKDSILFECGYNKPICNVTLKDKGDVIQTIALHKVILSSLAELNQFCEGLSVLGVSHAMKKHPLLLSPFFCYDEDMQLTPDFIRNMFTEIHYSEHGSNERAREDQAYISKF